MAQKRIAIIACSKRQSKNAKIVKEFYQGTLFRYGLDYAREVLAIPESDIYVLSTKHGLLSLYDKAPEPYNTPVQRIDKSRIGEVAKKLEEIKGDAEELVIYMLFGREMKKRFGFRQGDGYRLVSIYDLACGSEERSSQGRIIKYLRDKILQTRTHK